MNRKQLIIVGYYDVNSNVVLAAARREDLRFLKWFKEDASFKIDETVNYSTIATIFACCKVPDKGSYLPPDIVLQLYRNAYCRSLSLGKIVSDLRFWLSPSDFPTAQPPQKRDFVHARVCFDESLPFVQTVTCLEKSIDVFFDLISVNSFTVSQHPQLQTKLKHLMFLLQMKTKTPEEEQKFPLLIIDDRQPPPAKEELKTGNQPLVKAAAANCNVCEEPLYAGKFVRCSLQTCTCRMCYGCVVTWLSGKLPVQQSTACVKCKLGQLDIGAVVGLLPDAWMMAYTLDSLPAGFLSKTCFFCGAQNIFEKTEQRKYDHTECPVCTSYQCMRCDMQHHPGFPCLMLEATDEIKRVEGVVQCAQCGHIGMHDFTGCNKVHCSTCGKCVLQN